MNQLPIVIIFTRIIDLKTNALAKEAYEAPTAWLLYRFPNQKKITQFTATNSTD